MERDPTPWERQVLEALVSVDGLADGPDARTLRESLPHLVVTSLCGCGCPSFFVRDARIGSSEDQAGGYHFSNAVTPDHRIGMYLLVQRERPWSVDVTLPPDLDGSEPESRPDPRTLIISSPYAS